MRADVRRELRMAAVTLVGKCFEGHYRGRRVRGAEYLDVVELPPQEREIASELGGFAAALGRADADLFAGFTAGGGPLEPPGPAVWTRLGEGVPLGCHWFRIVELEAADGGVAPILDSLRHLPDREMPRDGSAAEREDAEPFVMPKIDVKFALNCLRIASTVLAALVVGAFKTIEFTGEFIIRFIDSSSIFLERSTPMFRMGLNFLTKVISALFALITVIFRGDKPIRVESAAPPIEYHPRRQPRGYQHFD